MLSGVTSGIVEEGALFGRPNPFYSWAKPYFVAPLEYEEASNLVITLGRRVALAWSEEAVALLFAATDGHAFYIRTLASHVVGKMPARRRVFRVEKEQVEDALPTWRRAMAARVREVFETLEVYYPVNAPSWTSPWRVLRICLRLPRSTPRRSSTSYS